MRRTIPPIFVILLSVSLSVSCLSSRSNLYAVDLDGFVRGDCNSDGSVDVSDPIYTLESLFGVSGETPGCSDACDVNDDGAINLADAIELLGAVFLGIPAALPAPLTCGFDPTSDPLGCDAPACTLPVSEERAFTLETARAGLPYLGDLPENQREGVTWQQNLQSGVIQTALSYVEYGLPIGTSLPGDLSLDGSTGVLTGTTIPSGLHALEIWARDGNGDHTLFHAELPSFSAAESEIIPGQVFSNGGFLLVAIQDEVFTYTHPLPWPTPYPLDGCTPLQPPATEAVESKNLRIYYPLTATAPTPLLIFHHGTGFNSIEYQQLLVHLASRGITCASVEDQFPYFELVDYYCWGGHDEAAEVLVSVRQLVESYNLDPTHPLFGRIDNRRVFYGGHSRGGASAMAAREIDPDVRGVLMLQGTDARQDSWIGNTNRWIDLPDVPVMCISAEQDTDVIYPFAERLLERFRGPTSMVTIYGGCHGYSTDASSNGCGVCSFTTTAPGVDSCRYIARSLQIDLLQHYATAFFQRYAFGNLSVEGILHGAEDEASPFVGVSYRRNLSGAIPVADFEDYPFTNSGGAIASSGALLFIKGTCYDWPFPLPAPIEAISNLVLIADPNGVTTFDLPIDVEGAALDVTGTKTLTFRVKNHDIHGVADNFGYFHLDMDLELMDSSGASASVPVDPHLPQTIFHPQPEPAGLNVQMKYQRFLSVTMPLGEFLVVNPSLDLTALDSIRVTITTNGTANVDARMGFDDFRFE